MGYMKVFEDMMEDKLMGLHTAYIAKVLSYSDGKASLQPLGMIKQYGKAAGKQSIVEGAPVVQSARYKITVEMRTCAAGDGGTEQREHLKLEPLAAGDLVFCVCAERDITQALDGVIATPQIGHHSRSDTVVVGVL